MNRFLLYGTSACHLCEQAAAMLDDARAHGLPFAYEEVDISEDDALFEAYGLTIPVLCHADGREMHWPFDPELLGVFLVS